MKYLVLFNLLFFSSFCFSGAEFRTMAINKVEPLGLEIWTEAEPGWNVSIISPAGKTAFIAESPQYYYPPSSMSWHSANFIEPVSDLRKVFDSALEHARRNYQVSADHVFQINEAKYDQLSGYETVFQGVANGVKLDIKVFLTVIGNKTVMMQAYTLPGKMNHLEYQIRRSWSNVRLLTQD